jgi:hypothetical protein
MHAQTSKSLKLGGLRCPKIKQELWDFLCDFGVPCGNLWEVKYFQILHNNHLPLGCVSAQSCTGTFQTNSYIGGPGL